MDTSVKFTVTPDKDDIVIMPKDPKTENDIGTTNSSGTAVISSDPTGYVRKFKLFIYLIIKLCFLMSLIQNFAFTLKRNENIFICAKHICSQTILF